MSRTSRFPMSGKGPKAFQEGEDRPPDWRWQRANALVRSGDRPTRRDDSLVRQACTYLKWLDNKGKKRTAPARLRLVQIAHELRTSNDLFNISLETAALAGDPLKPLAASFAMPDDLPVVLEQLFFDVRDKLDDRLYIYKYEVFPGLQSDSEKDQDASLYKAVAYEFGWRVFEGVLIPNALFSMTLLPGQDINRTGMLRALGTAARCVWNKERKKDGPLVALAATVAMIKDNMPVIEKCWDKIVRLPAALGLQAEYP